MKEFFVALRISGILLGFFSLAALLISLFFSEQSMPSFRFVRHSHCSLCGMSRAFVALSHGNFSKAIALNPAAPIIYVTFACLSLYFLFQVVSLLHHHRLV